MWKFPTTLFVIVVSTSLIAVDADFIKCNKVNGHYICGSGHLLLSVDRLGCDENNGSGNQTAENLCPKNKKELRLILDDFSIIASDAFKGTNFIRVAFTLSSENCLNEINCTIPETLDELSSVKDFELNCVVFIKESNLFKNLKSLEKLYIKNVEFIKLSENFLSDLPKLQILSLERTKILAITPDTFSGINPGLQELNLMYDNLEVIEDRSFKKLYNLTRLYIDNNDLTDLSPDMFDGLNALKIFSVRSNNITVLRNNTFSKLSQLKDVDLSQNKISKIEAGTFFGLPVYSINLKYNELEDLPVGGFKNLPNLRYLFLNHNKISILRKNVFEGLGQMVDLSLAYNVIHHIEPYAFQGLSISNLYLNNNKLNVIETDTFNGLYNNKYIYLAQNKITKIETHQVFRNVTVYGPLYILLSCDISKSRKDDSGFNTSVPRFKKYFICI